MGGTGATELGVRFQTENNSVLNPSQFQVNEAWIAFKLNDAPVSTDTDGDFNILALMDAASCFILGMEFVGTHSTEPSQLESKRLLKGGQSHKQQYPKTLFIPISQAANILCTEAELQGISVLRVPEEQLLVFIGEARQGFQARVSGGKVQ